MISGVWSNENVCVTRVSSVSDRSLLSAANELHSLAVALFRWLEYSANCCCLLNSVVFWDYSVFLSFRSKFTAPFKVVIEQYLFSLFEFDCYVRIQLNFSLFGNRKLQLKFEYAVGEVWIDWVKVILFSFCLFKNGTFL